MYEHESVWSGTIQVYVNGPEIERLSDDEEDLEANLRMSLFHEVGHGLFEWINELPDSVTEPYQQDYFDIFYDDNGIDEEDIVEEFGQSFQEDSITDYSQLRELIELMQSDGILFESQITVHDFRQHRCNNNRSCDNSTRVLNEDYFDKSTVKDFDDEDEQITADADPLDFQYQITLDFKDLYVNNLYHEIDRWCETLDKKNLKLINKMRYIPGVDDFAIFVRTEYFDKGDCVKWAEVTTADQISSVVLAFNMPEPSLFNMFRVILAYLQSYYIIRTNLYVRPVNYNIATLYGENLLKLRNMVDDINTYNRYCSVRENVYDFTNKIADGLGIDTSDSGLCDAFGIFVMYTYYSRYTDKLVGRCRTDHGFEYTLKWKSWGHKFEFETVIRGRSKREFLVRVQRMLVLSYRMAYNCSDTSVKFVIWNKTGDMVYILNQMTGRDTGANKLNYEDMFAELNQEPTNRFEEAYQRLYKRPAKMKKPQWFAKVVQDLCDLPVHPNPQIL